MKRILLFLSFFLFFALPAARAVVYYVDGSGGSNGNTGTGSWANAKKDIQNAINAAADGDQIWVKAGTYLPTLDPNGGTSQRDKTFYITTKDVKLYGGFAGTETLLSQRNATTNVTILSGDLDGTAGTTDAYHVMLNINRTSACVVDGFTITGGRGNIGGSINVSAPATSIYRPYGGGMYNYNSSPTISNCIFSANTTSTDGGGMYNTNNSSPAISNCVFLANTCNGGGGGMFSGSNCNVSLTNCVFQGNTSVIGSGGGMSNVNNTPAITSCTFSANTAAAGGGMYFNDYAGGSMTNCILYDNTGGPAARQNLYKAGTAATLTVSYTLIGDYDAAAANTYTASNVFSADPLFVDAATPAGADGVFRTSDDGLRISCTSPARDAGTGTTPATDILGNTRAGTAIDMGAYENPGTGCPNVLYVDGGKADNSGNGYGWGGAKKDVQAAINAAAGGDEIWVKTGTYLPTLDANGNAAPTDPRDKMFYITTKDVKLYGGFAGTETLLSQRNPTTNTTTLSGDLDGTGGTADAYHVLLTINRTLACVVDGFTISGGRANGSSSSFPVTTPSANITRELGGGIYNQSSSPTVSGCTFSANTATFGGGIYNQSSSPAISSCTLNANTAISSGGGMYNQSSSPAVSGCTFSANTAALGGGIYNSYSGSLTVSGCTFSANTATTSGGGMFNTYSNPAVSNCVFTSNMAGRNGGGMYSGSSSSPVISSCTFSANTASANGGGLYYFTSSGGSFANSMVYGSTGSTTNRKDIYKDGTNTVLMVSYSLIGDYSTAATNNYSASNILTADPSFVDASNPAGTDGLFGTADDGLRLQGCSSAINAGDGNTPATDISGNSRVGVMDLGAYEYQGSPAPLTLASGSGTADSRNIQAGSVVSLGGCGTAIAEVRSTGAQPVEGIVSATMYVHPTAPSINQTAYMRRHYDISTIIFPSTATAYITLYFTQADFDDYNTAIQGSGLPSLPIDATDAAGNKGNLRITQEHGTSATGLPDSYSGWGGSGPKKVLITPTVSWSPLLSLWKVQFPVVGFSGFFVTSAISAPLPLHLLRFSARQVGEHTNQLDWATGEEEAGAGFVVERSSDAKNFISIGAISGKGSSSAYRFMDNAPLTADNYYRLQMKEAGKTGYSQTVLVKVPGVIREAVEISPNPATDRVMIVCKDKTLEGSKASVWSAKGRLMKTFVLESETVLDVSEWTAGVYVMRLADGGTLRLIKQ